MKKRVNEAESYSEAIPDGRGCEEGSSQNTGEIQTKREVQQQRGHGDLKPTWSCDKVWVRKEVTAQEKDLSDFAETKLLCLDYKTSANTLLWPLSLYC